MDLAYLLTHNCYNQDKMLEKQHDAYKITTNASFSKLDTFCLTYYILFLGFVTEMMTNQ